jgi:hypothetical protein
MASSIDPESVAILTAASQEDFPKGQVAIKSGLIFVDGSPKSTAAGTGFCEQAIAPVAEMHAEF